MSSSDVQRSRPSLGSTEDLTLPKCDARTARGDYRRRLILDVARQTFLRDGYASASMSAIALAAGGSKGTLYAHFPSKAELFASVMNDLCAAHRVELWTDMDRELGLEDILVRLGSRYVDLMLSNDVITLHRLVVSESVRFPELGEVLYAAGPQLGKAALAECIREFINRGMLKAKPHLTLAGQFLDLCLTGLYRRRLWGVVKEITAEERSLNVASAVEVFLSAYANPNGLVERADQRLNELSPELG